MSSTPHTLGDEFPGRKDQILALKGSDTGFAKLLLEYDEVNDEIHRAVTNITPDSQDHETELRKRRLAIEDQISQSLAKAA
jgi:uncharacterized protein